MLFLGLGIATIIPLISLYAIRALDFYRTGSQRILVLAFMWGVMSFTVASAISGLVFEAGWIRLSTLLLVFAPVLEECLKSLILVYLIRREDFTYFVDGAIYGFAVGIGFAIFENASYLLLSPASAVSLAGARALSVNLIHASASSLVGMALGLTRFRKRSGGVTIALGGLLLAIILHAAFNRLVTITASGLLMYSTAAGLGAMGFIGLAIRRGLSDERGWIAETLAGMAGVTRAERDAVDSLDQLTALLNMLSKHFGAERADRIHRLLLLQARIGILQKTSEKIADADSRMRLEGQIADITRQMEDQRRQVGAYAMLYLRNAFPEEASPLWDRLSLAIEAQIRARQDAPPLFDVFARLDDVLEAARASAAADE